MPLRGGRGVGAPSTVSVEVSGPCLCTLRVPSFPGVLSEASPWLPSKVKPEALLRSPSWNALVTSVMGSGEGWVCPCNSQGATISGYFIQDGSNCSWPPLTRSPPQAPYHPGSSLSVCLWLRVLPSGDSLTTVSHSNFTRHLWTDKLCLTFLPEKGIRQDSRQQTAPETAEALGTS